MTGRGRRARRQRRAVRRPSTAENIDRSADTPRHGFGLGGAWDESAGDADAARDVLLDPEADDEPHGLEFFLEQRPPHYGG